MSGKEQALLLVPPLRTVRASFPAYGSSLYKLALTRKPATDEISHHHTFYHDNGSNSPQRDPLILRFL